ncbi:hypothetical protein ACFWUP_17715 [Nocardia sp. NPDC058658]|uniref:RipA family octameric membrane protein n=1 Tax=Nocardia sp. NPDC058658 TaxID=3346580 RepID=UPI00365041F7
MVNVLVRQWHRASRVRHEYFGAATAPSVADVEGEIWTPGVDADTWGREVAYNTALLEQYKLYVEMADRISARRGLTNTFFLTLNTAVVTVVGGVAKERSGAPDWLLLFPLFALLLQCLAWYWLVRSYRQLNAGKYVVIGAIEQRLPAGPYWRAEWAALGRGEAPSRYLPMTHVEQLIPMLFASTYVAGFIALLAS